MQDLLRECVIGQEAFDFTAGGALPGVIQFYINRPAGQLSDELGKLAYADFTTGAEMDGFPHRSGCFGGLNKAIHSVANIVQITGRRQISKPYFLARQALGNDGWDNGT